MMSEPDLSRLMIAAPQNVGEKLCAIFAQAGIAPAVVCHSGQEAVLSAGEAGALLVTTFRLPDMSGEEMAAKLGETSDVLMIVPQDFAPQNALPETVITLRNPVSPEALVQSVRVLARCRARMDALRKREKKLERMLEERKVIERAKGRLMDQLHLSEAEAHYRMQKTSMDTGRRIIDIAREILDAAENIAS